MNIAKLSLSLLCVSYFSLIQADVIEHFNQIKNDPNALYTFFKTMPKGGELHYHLAGGAYPETMLLLASEGNYCINKTTFAISPNTQHCDGIQSKEIMSQPEFYSKVIKSWSMKDFIPGEESGHDHFFNGFSKYISIVFNYRPALLAEIVQRAAQQQEQYLEILDIPDNGQSIKFGDLIKGVPSYSEKRRLLLANTDFQNNITNAVNESDNVIQQTRDYLGCEKNPQSPPCKVKIKFLYYALREQPLDNVFAQALSAFEAASRSKGTIVGVNLVQAEDGIISLHDYRKQMQIFKYLHQMYPKVPVSLHAGELASEAVVPEELSYHIHEALFTGQAQRIGHGSDIGYENNVEDILKYMAEQSVPVEISLISNQKILNLSGRAHPINYYLSHHVPVVLSTDDEGVLRTDLTHQYVAAVMKHNVDYPTLKQINRNALTYAFLPGKSIWANASKAVPIQECSDLNSERCKEVIKDSEKATLQWNLEQKLISFENQYNNEP
ncbi:adenosine deaminase family protein [Legionella fallonii]|uniref:adenosine deaminase n=1 Tax=Legionella fallonii LLAP-10 TaxID=1212491 RepID=A0A098G677_9GAMM|nr:adenosine deaminase [Legionella fallonii]CEG58003.1 conserved exported protein of unknown function [Legionella fallonii LLAP-10]